MPQKSNKPCAQFGCPELVTFGISYCDKHKRNILNDNNRKDFRQRGYATGWDKVRILKLAMNPLCEECIKNNNITPAQMVHHKIKVVDRPDLTFDLDNLVSLCVSCHGKKHRKGVKG